MKATFVKKADGFAEHAELFRLERPKTENGVTFEFITVSTLECAFDTGLPETYIFPTNSNGKVLNWGELKGSFQGAMDISKALRDGGYEEVRQKMEHVIVKKVGEDAKLYLDREGAFGAKERAYPMPRWLARVVLGSCFAHSDRFYIEEAR